MREGEKAQVEWTLEPELSERVRALDRGRALVDLTWWRKVLATGSDAAGWLNDLLAADLSGLDLGEARRSLLLSPTGRVRADVTVVLLSQGHLLVQDPSQPEPIDALLGPYVLSSDVSLEDRTAALAVLALPERTALPEGSPGEGWMTTQPSCLGTGLGFLGPSADRDAALQALKRGGPGLIEVGEDAVEAWRIARGVARFPVDLTPESLPHETDVGDAIAYRKGCYLGQEAAARVRNLGHPPFVLLPLRSEGPVSPGDPVLADEDDAGTVTSATPLEGGGFAVIARIRWAARQAGLRTATGSVLEPVTPPASSE
ncbi:MAG: YgfZ/GcvT domain-containing protein [Actinomycetota bacterium]